jgi:hypothetical protein
VQVSFVQVSFQNANACPRHGSAADPAGATVLHYHGRHCGKATVMPNRTVVCGATGASRRYAIHSPLTKRLIGDNPFADDHPADPKLSGRVIEES